MRGASVSTSFHTNLFDTSAPPTGSPSTSAIVSEACSVINAAGLAPDTNAVYHVYTSNFPGGRVSFCAWHGSGTCNGVTIQVAYMPNTTGIAGCDPGDLYGCNSYSQGTRSLANVSSHEYMEAITDPDSPNAWYDSAGAEIGDKCAWKFSSCVNLGSAGGSWQLQQEWSNKVSGCVQQ
jgi:serine protease